MGLSFSAVEFPGCVISLKTMEDHKEIGIDAVKAKFIDELQHDGLGCLVVARILRTNCGLGTRSEAR